MGYRLRLHGRIRDWLTGLRDTEPELARDVGEALLALIDAGAALGPPLVVSLASGEPEDPRAALDRSYQRQLEMLTKVRRGVADVATSRKRVELQVTSLEQHAASLARQREEAHRAGREDLAQEAGARAADAGEQLAGLRRQHAVLAAEESKLSQASMRLQAKVEAFRVRKETIKASYTAAEASRSVREAMADIEAEGGREAPGQDSREAAGQDSREAPAEGAAPVPSPLTAGADELLREVRGQVPSAGGGPESAAEGVPGPGDREDVPVPDGMMELRAGAPGDVRAGLLFVVASPGTAIVLAHVTDPGSSASDYQDAIRAAAERLPAVGAGPAAAPEDTFTSYDADSFLDEFFPGAETEVEIGAGALVARSRAHTLAEARQRMGLTQAQVARRMSVRQERVSAIERAGPGATEVRTLAAYVGALGGRLEIVAHIGGDDILLR